MGEVSLLLVHLLIALILTGSAYAEDNPARQREMFQQARQAIEDGQHEAADKLVSQLDDYLLYPYLRYWQMSADLSKADNKAIDAFLQQYAEIPVTDDLRTRWLFHLARNKRSKEFLAYDNGSRNRELTCYRHIAQLDNGNKSAAWKGAKRLWLVGHSQHRACDPLFEAWEKAGGITPELRWQRVELSMNNGQTGLARYLAKSLDKAQQDKLELWRRIYTDPMRIERTEALKKDTAFNRKIIVQGLVRLANRQHAQAAPLWGRIEPHYKFSQAERNEINRALGLNYAFDGDSQALKWFEALPASARDLTVRSWAARAALRNLQWQAALDWISGMPERERNGEDWRYWQARAHEALGNKKEAATLYRLVGTERSYYGFLAADRNGDNYNLSHAPLQVDEALLTKLRQNTALQRALELHQLGLYNEARSEWGSAIAKLSQKERLAAGKLADQQQWHDRALITLAKANHFDDLDIRFPLIHMENFTQAAEGNKLDPSWVLAVARQESALVPDARSSVGALGLMQLMPETGLNIARQLKTPLTSKSELLQPETNIRLGSYYLRQVLDRFNDNTVLATAAYNAGPHRVDEWQPEQEKLDADIWVDTIPFYETRQYLRRVFAYTVFYDRRLHETPGRLDQRMPPVIHPQLDNECTKCPATAKDKS